MVNRDELIHYVFYDIEIDGIRNKVAEICKDYGLERIQFSGFSGSLGRNRREELYLKLKRAMKDTPGRFLILPVCAKDMKNSIEYFKEKEDGGADIP